MVRIKRKSSSYEPRLVGFPFVFIITGWIMLWFIWPNGEKFAFKPAAPFRSRVAFIGNFSGGYSNYVYSAAKPAAGDEDVAKPLPWMAVRPVKLLEKNVIADGLSESEKMSGELRDMAGREINTYMPVWQDQAVFSAVADETMRLTVEPSGQLAEYGFQVQDFSSALKKTDKPWIAMVIVQVDEKGKVENVFLDAGCESREINSLVVKSMYRGTVSKIGKRIEGRVMVNFGQD